MAEFQEYPKGLYLNGEETAENVVVFNKEEEDAKREEGYKMLSDTKELSEKDILFNEAKELGIDAKKTWGIDKLKEAIANVKED